MNEPRFDPRFGRGELGDAFGPDADEALEMGRWLQASIDESAMSLPAAATGFDAATEARGGLADRVMAALEDEPAPAPTGFLLPLRRRGFLRGLGASVRQAWVGLGGSGRPLLARGAALAYVLVITIAGVSLTGAATIGAAGALGLLGQATPSPTPTLPAPTLAPPSVEPSVPPSTPPIVSPSPSPSPSESPEESDDDGGSGAESSDDHGGDSGTDGSDDNSGPGSSDSGSDGSDDSSDSSGSDSDSDSSTPEPTQTPKPSETPH